MEKNEFTNFLKDGTQNIIQSCYDNFIESNAQLRSTAGLKSTITRMMLGECCEWCAAIAGSYEYGKEPKDIYRRHKNCDCVVIFKSEKRYYQDSHTDKKYGTPKEVIEKRIQEIEVKAKKIADPKALEEKLLKSIDDNKMIRFTTSDEEVIIIKNKQFSKKIGKHTSDYGLNPSDASSREKMKNIIQDIVSDYDEVRIGTWRGADNDGYKFYLKGEDVVLVSPLNEFVTILKGGITNGQFSSARIKVKRR